MKLLGVVLACYVILLAVPTKTYGDIAGKEPLETPLEISRSHQWGHYDDYITVAIRGNVSMIFTEWHDVVGNGIVQTQKTEQHYSAGKYRINIPCISHFVSLTIESLTKTQVVNYAISFNDDAGLATPGINLIAEYLHYAPYFLPVVVVLYFTKRPDYSYGQIRTDLNTKSARALFVLAGPCCHYSPHNVPSRGISGTGEILDVRY